MENCLYQKLPINPSIKQKAMYKKFSVIYAPDKKIKRLKISFNILLNDITYNCCYRNFNA